MNTTRPLPMLALIIAAFGLPFALGAALYFSGWQPQRTANHGELVRPPLPLPRVGLHNADGSVLTTADLHGRWWLLVAPAGRCDAACVVRVIELRQVHVALNKDMVRLKRMVLADDAAEHTIEVLRAAQPDLVVARADDGWRRALGGAGTQQILLVDPQARLVMRYGAAADADSIRTDLERLLRFGSAG